MNYLILNIRGIGGVEKPLWISKLVKENNISYLCIQETQVSNVDAITIGRYWGKADMEWDSVDARGRSGGLTSVWDPGLFAKKNVVKHDSFLLVSGILAGTNTKVNIINVYAPCDVTRRRALWEELKTIKESTREGIWIMGGDFNEVRGEHERMNSKFDHHGARIFNNFIAEAGLVEYQMGGYKFTHMSDDGSNLSKIDRILVCESFMNCWPTARFEALTKHVSDHSPLALSCANKDFGPISFRFYNSWLEDEGLEEIVKKGIEEATTGGSNMKEMAYILKNLKTGIKAWRRAVKIREEKEVSEATEQVEKLEKMAESRTLSGVEKECRVTGKWKIRNYERKKLMDLKQKAKFRWAKLGDENSKFFHTIINCRKARNNINVLKVNGNMTSDPKEIKAEVKTKFMSRFVEPLKHRPSLDGRNFKKISKEQASALTERFSIEEIKKAVWMCGSDRAPGQAP
ncbi:uncharacterized protein LOC110932266 [Helianthus annuus]|uniref:uncharacterized protein LOC110932266 n=1 Tax=Helianthus annuus TaxID=4232 RepID=UPI000B906C77|nr:uncharacterized protein LOC110932266 [Helianthus annuus]